MLTKVPRTFLRRGLRTQSSSVIQNRSFSSSLIVNGNSQFQTQSNVKEENDSSEQATPWYLRESVKPVLESPLSKVERPSIPLNSPEALQMTVDHMALNLGLTDFSIFDMRHRDDDLPISSSTEFVVLCEGKSEKHLQNATQDVVSFLKKEMKTKPSTEGLTKSNSQAKIRQRLRKTGKSHKNTSFGVESNSWIIINTPENISFHLLSPQRRAELNLEELFCEEHERSRYQQINQQRTLPQLDHDSIFAGIFKRHFSTATAPASEDFEAVVLKHIMNEDLASYEKISSKVISDSALALTALKSINTNLMNIEVEGISDDRLQTLRLLFDRSFPTAPELSHFEERLVFYRNLNFLAPECFTFNEIIKCLRSQVEAGVSLTNSQLELSLQSIKTLKNDTSKSLELFNIIGYLNSFDELFKSSRFSVLLLDLFVEKGTTSPNFKEMVSFLKQYELSNEVTGFIISAFVQSNNRIALWEFWNSLDGYSITSSGEAVIDTRPWNSLISVIHENSLSGEITENAIMNDLFNIQLAQCASLTDPDSRAKLEDLLNRFDGSGRGYEHARSLINN
ncbi:hypothetical protein WICPIJ_005743 [Wickerhamomyces pijperi]|uniref:ATPase synthesis protein 25 n=1 Tax=Wickerhamomyces pijperi TaxID=599730 RepID=A0A9P8Q5K1_WICPI|nr:hypothetical protein WICPIJ_005743 [Wickerhamomyces pijperi]